MENFHHFPCPLLTGHGAGMASCHVDQDHRGFLISSLVLAEQEKGTFYNGLRTMLGNRCFYVIRSHRYTGGS